MEIQDSTQGDAVVPVVTKATTGNSHPGEKSKAILLKSSDKAVVDNNDIATVSRTHHAPIVTRWELWSYYLYYNGDNGVGPLGFSMTLFQSLANSAGYDPVRGPGSSCSGPDASGQCVLPWGSGTKAVSSVVLIANGVSFAVSSAADYGTFGRWLLLSVTCVCWASQYAEMSLTSPSRWRLAMGLYIIGFVSYGATLVFYAALFPRLARNTLHSRTLKERYLNGEITHEVYEVEESLEKNRISNISTQSRPGPPLPKGETYLTIGWKQIWAAMKEYKKLPYTFLYLFAYFLLADGLNTTGTLISICQNDKFEFSFLENTYLGLAQAITSTASTFGFWYIQKYFKITTKRMFVVTNVVTVLIPLWGMLGIWTNKIGFHNVWEFWAYNVVFGIFQAPYYAFAQTMMAELTPPGYDNMFFGLFGLSNRASSMIGPNVIQAIIDNSGSNWKGFPFLFALCLCASFTIWFYIDVQKGRNDAVKWAEEKQKESKVEG
ncbi:hypothetical protein CVT24_011858 [Panaeolus cyanescens]|uniref:Autophagy-related protein n=1 Tax=Panaeolus cyanescens TaxID=181874 RepID=A0A409YNM0_9AGAR|nr:hypothetical protein CVT24_011858 [Panaeolus cyanescens]